MDQYMAQKADQALEELLNDVPLERRIQLVIMHLEQVASPHHLRNAPPTVQEAMARLQAEKGSSNIAVLTFSARRAITTILEAWGYQEGTRKEAAAIETD